MAIEKSPVFRVFVLQPKQTHLYLSNSIIITNLKKNELVAKNKYKIRKKMYW